MSYTRIDDSTPFKDYLSGNDAFYKKDDYKDVTQNDFSTKKAVPVTYEWNTRENTPISETKNKVIRIAKIIFGILFLPVGIGMLIHYLAGKLIVPASIKFIQKEALEDYSTTFVNSKEWKYKRVAIKVDGFVIDAAIMGKADTLNKGRWLLRSAGNAEFYENSLDDHEFKHILTKTNANGIVFNYPGVKGSSGMPSKSAMAKAYRAVLNFLEDEEKGIGAKEIIAYGHSIGGGVQSEAMKSHQEKEGVNYVFVKSRTFSNLKDTASRLIARPIGFLVKLFGWNFDSAKTSKQLTSPEIIIQTADTNQTLEITKKDQRDKIRHDFSIIHDDVIHEEISLGHALIHSKVDFVGKKILIQTRAKHNDSLFSDASIGTTIQSLTDEINTALEEQKNKPQDNQV